MLYRTTVSTYDPQNRLTSIAEWDGGELQTQEQMDQKKIFYTYDPAGNRTKETDSVSGETLSMTYDAANRLTGYEKKKDGTAILNQKNRYNGEGQRIRKEEMKGAESRVRNYYYQKGGVAYTTDENCIQTSFNLWGHNGNLVAAAKERENGTKWYIYNKDTRRSISSIIDDTGTVVAAYEYDEFGNTKLRIGEDFENEFCYTGQVYDQSTGLYYYNARFYDPEDGRFLTQDTYRGEQDEPDTLHLYAYCSNDPVNYIDPSGHAKYRWRGTVKEKLNRKYWFKVGQKEITKKVKKGKGK